MFNKILNANRGDQPEYGAATSGNAAQSNRFSREARTSDLSLLASRT